MDLLSAAYNLPLSAALRSKQTRRKGADHGGEPSAAGCAVQRQREISKTLAYRDLHSGALIPDRIGTGAGAVRGSRRLLYGRTTTTWLGFVCGRASCLGRDCGSWSVMEWITTDSV
jgi:hypothetical protein